jgi:Mg-chelatase subunit ChlD
MGGGKLDAAKAALLRLVSKTMHKRDRLAVIAFEHELQRVCDGYVGDTNLPRLLDGIAPRGGTQLWGAVLAGLALLEDHCAARRIAAGGDARADANRCYELVVLTDGHDGSYTVAATDLAAHLAACTLPCFNVTIVGVGADVDTAALPRLTGARNGKYIAVDDDKGIATAFGKIGQRMRKVRIVTTTTKEVRSVIGGGRGDRGSSAAGRHSRPHTPARVGAAGGAAGGAGGPGSE